MFSGPRVRISPSAAILISMPATARPTVPSLNASGVLAVKAPVVSVMPYTSRILMPSPAKNLATSCGSGAAALDAIISPSPSSERIGCSTLASACRNCSASSSGVVCPYWQLSTYFARSPSPARRPPAGPGRLLAASSAMMPAWIFSQTRGTPKKAVGRTSPSVPTSSVAAS